MQEADKDTAKSNAASRKPQLILVTDCVIGLYATDEDWFATDSELRHGRFEIEKTSSTRELH